MTTTAQILSDLSGLLGADIVQGIDATSLERLTHDYCVHGRKDVGIHALVLPRNTEQITLRHESWTPPQSYPFADTTLKPLAGGEVLHWRMA